MKKPWLVSQMGQRLTVWLGGLLALLLLLSLIPFVTAVTLPRTDLPQLDTGNVTYCEINTCDLGNSLGLKIRDISVSENEFEATISIELVNEKRWDGEREAWMQFRTKTGVLIEMAKGEMILNDKTATLELSFTGSIAELNDLQWFLGL